MSSRRKFTQEFKREAVQMSKAAGVSARQVARELGINPNVLSRWGRELQSAGEQAFAGPGKARDEGTATLRRELAHLAAERHQLLGVASLAAHAQEPLLQPATLQVGLELPLHEGWQRPASLGAQLTKFREVLPDELIQQRRFGSVPGIAGWIEKWRRTRSPRSNGDGHGGRPGNGRGRN